MLFNTWRIVKENCWAKYWLTVLSSSKYEWHHNNDFIFIKISPLSQTSMPHKTYISDLSDFENWQNDACNSFLLRPSYVALPLNTRETQLHDYIIILISSSTEKHQTLTASPRRTVFCGILRTAFLAALVSRFCNTGTTTTNFRFCFCLTSFLLQSLIRLGLVRLRRTFGAGL